MSLWLVVAQATDHPENVPGSLGAVLALTAELDARFAATGLGSVAGALDAQRRLLHVLDTLDPHRLAALGRAVTELEGRLRAHATSLARLLDVKRRLANAER